MKKTKLHLNPLAAAIAIALPASVALPAMAQPQLEEVIVTAAKREQSLQDVPVAVTAFSADELAAGGVSDVTELQKSSPNTTLEVGRGTNSTLTAFIRGIGQQDPLWGFEPGVGIYVDDVYWARPQGAVLDVFDVERIEVLRGPQGTLYGKNTIGGAVKYVTRRMTGEANGFVKTAVGSYNQVDMVIGGQAPIVEDVLYIGGSLATLNRDGYGENKTLDIENGGKDITTGRLSLEWTPTDSLFVRAAFDSTNDESNAVGPYVIVANPNTTAFEQRGSVHDTYGGIENSDGPGSQDVDSKGAALTVEWDASESLVVKSITAYREGSTFNTQIDFDGSPLEVLDVYAFYEDDQLSQELQVNFTTDRLSVVGGLYYFEGDAAGAFDAPLLDSGAGAVLNLTTGGNVETISQSAYADVTFDVTDAFQVFGGLRYTSDEKTAEIYNVLTLPTTQGCVVNGECPIGLFRVDTYRVDSPVPGMLLDVNDPTSTPTPEGSLNETYTDVSPRIGFNYDLNDDMMLYTSYSRGFKSGGFDMRANEAVRGVSVTDGFDPETVDAFELGLKGEFMNRTRLNIALFRSDYKDLQAVNPVVQGQTSPVNAVENVGQATLQGLELESLTQVNEVFSINFAMGYIDTSIDEYLVLDPTDPLDANGNPTLDPVDVSDDRDIQNTPDFNSSLKLMWDKELESGYLNFNVAASYRADVQMFETPSPIDQEAYTLFDAGITWSNTAENTIISLHAKNLTDEEYRVSGYNFGGGFQFSSAFYGAPRTYTASVTYKF